MFGEMLPNEAVGVFIEPPFPLGIGMRKEEARVDCMLSNYSNITLAFMKVHPLTCVKVL